jgi:hypothetical protein
MLGGAADPDVSWHNWVVRVRETGKLADTVQAAVTRTPEGNKAETAGGKSRRRVAHPATGLMIFLLQLDFLQVRTPISR